MRKFQPVFLLLSLSLVSPGQTSEIVLPGPKLVDAGLAVELVADGFERPVFLSAPPGDRARLFVVNQNGLIHVIENGTVLNKPFLDITNKVASGGEQGLLSMAFDPNYGNNGRFYVNYTNRKGNTVVSSFKVRKKNPNAARRKSERIILRVAQPYGNHNGGQLQFGPDGYLYIGLGDGGSHGDPQGFSQDLTSHLGKMLRIDVSILPYSIPITNPYADPVESGIIARPEIWASGLRNPWRFSFDRKTGDLYIADVGQNRREEIDFQPASSKGGENYGWNVVEGSRCFLPNNCNKSGLVPPIHEYNHAGGDCSVTGGYVYRGPAIKRLQGHYFFADYCTGRIWTFRYRNGAVRDLVERTAELSPIGGKQFAIVSFGEDAEGELYICDYSGAIYKIVKAQ